jgi:hypothetical protein
MDFVCRPTLNRKWNDQLPMEAWHLIMSHLEVLPGVCITRLRMQKLLDIVARRGRWQMILPAFNPGQNTRIDIRIDHSEPGYGYYTLRTRLHILFDDHDMLVRQGPEYMGGLARRRPEPEDLLLFLVVARRYCIIMQTRGLCDCEHEMEETRDECAARRCPGCGRTRLGNGPERFLI